MYKLYCPGVNMEACTNMIDQSNFSMGRMVDLLEMLQNSKGKVL